MLSSDFINGVAASSIVWGLLAIPTIRHFSKENKALASSSCKDNLTGLFNREKGLKSLEKAIDHARRYNGTMSLLFLDLDEFKEVNDSYGHATGDFVLKEVAHRLKSYTRGGDTIVRLGGDEFLAILPSTDATGAGEVANKLIEKLNLPIVIKNKNTFIAVNIGVSIGIAEIVETENATMILNRADIALYASKNSGKNTVTLALES